MRSKKSLTLIEIVIALSLIGIVLFTLTSLYKNFIKSSEVVDRMSEKMVKRHLACARLDQIFSQLCKRDDVATLLYSTPSPSKKGSALSLSWDNKVHYDARLSGIQKAELLCDEKQWFLRYELKDGMHQEVLLDKVAKMEVEFFDKEKKAWVLFWEKEAKKDPALLRIKLRFHDPKESPYQMGFFIHSKDSRIVYGGEK